MLVLSAPAQQLQVACAKATAWLREHAECRKSVDVPGDALSVIKARCAAIVVPCSPYRSHLIHLITIRSHLIHLITIRTFAYVTVQARSSAIANEHRVHMLIEQGVPGEAVPLHITGPEKFVAPALAAVEGIVRQVRIISRPYLGLISLISRPHLAHVSPPHISPHTSAISRPYLGYISQYAVLIESVPLSSDQMHFVGRQVCHSRCCCNLHVARDCTSVRG